MQHSPETKAAVMADLMAGGSVKGTARKHGLAIATVRTWRNQSRHLVSVEPQKTNEIGDLLYELLVADLKGLINIARLTADPDWLKRQNAEQLAIFSGVRTDKAVGLLRSLRATDGETEPELQIPSRSG